jgi:hypothetical protein
MQRPSATDFDEPQLLAVSGDSFWVRIRQGALAAVQQLNLQFIELLCERAATGAQNFPLPPPLRERLASLPLQARLRLSASGTLLTDVGFSDPTRWRNVGTREETPSTDPTKVWASHEDAMALAHSTLVVAWYIVQASPSLAGVLLRMPSDTRIAYGTLGLSDVAHIARYHSDWLRPRWELNRDAWLSLLEAAISAGDGAPADTTLRSLQLAGDRDWIKRHFRT